MPATTTVQTTVALSNLRITVTGADVSYVGSVTIDSVLCDYLGIADRQLLQIRNETTGVDLWTYVIYGRRSCAVPPGTLCLNGAAAHLVTIGDVVNLTTWGHFPAGVSSLPIEPRTWDAVANGFDPEGPGPDELWASMASVQMAVGKVHRPRISDVRVADSTGGNGPSLALDKDWADEAGLMPGQNAHVVNINTGQRDELPIKLAKAGSQDCILTLPASGAHESKNASRAGHFKGDIVIAMSYGMVPRKALMTGAVPMMKIAFPCEKMVDESQEPLNTDAHGVGRTQVGSGID